MASALVDVALHRAITSEEVRAKGAQHASLLIDVGSFEEKELTRLQMPSGMVLRHRPAHFMRTNDSYVMCWMQYSTSVFYKLFVVFLFLVLSFIPYVILSNIMNVIINSYYIIFTDLFSDSSYASAYYVYLWAEVLDAGISSSRG